MKHWWETFILCCLLQAFGFGCRDARPHRSCPNDLCDAGTAADAAAGVDAAADTGPPPPPDSGVDASFPEAGLDWVALVGGRFEMGSPEGEGEPDEHPQHTVDVPDFELTRTEVTVRQYAVCVEAGACAEPETDIDDGGTVYCNWAVEGREDHPVNCVTWDVASAFCQWVGGLLPSEAQWEYAARSGGQDIDYPWGDDEPTCERAIFNEDGVGCGESSTWPVCSLPLGDSAQGVCDLIGNVWEWLADRYHPTYEGAPTDGSIWEEGNDAQRCIRGGGIDQQHAEMMRAANRVFHLPDFQYGGAGFRCAR